ncbi:MAG: hypothetical protein MK008_09750 [Bdellovibrionales bacterium]|nr:hypothetical protein [Bdellovibrionales bacterium]
MDNIRFTEEDPIYHFQNNIIEKIQSSERAIRHHTDEKVYEQNTLVKSLMKYIKDYEEYYKSRLLLKVLIVTQLVSLFIIAGCFVFYYFLGLPTISDNMIIYDNPKKVMTDDNKVYLEF